MKASVIVLSWNGIEYLDDCLNAVISQDYADFEVIVVDNGSTDGSAELVAERFPQVQLIRNERNLGFARGNNVGLRAATGDVLVLLNQDTVVHDGWLTALVAALDDPTVGIVGCKMLYPDGTIQHAGASLCDARALSIHIGRYELDQGQYDKARDVDFVTGATMALTRSTLVRVGPLDEGFDPVYFEDVDWCYRVREANLRVVYWPAATVTHYESTSVHVDSYAHKAVYHYGRLRLLFKHKPLSWLQQEFAPAEIDGVRQMGRISEMMAVRDAYLCLMLSLPEILLFRSQSADKALGGQRTQEEWEALLSLVSDLRSACIQDSPQETLYTQLEYTQEHAVGTRILEKAPDTEILSETSCTEPEPSKESPTEQLIPEQLWADLHSQWQIKEQPFHSDVPVVGSGIAAFRQAWNNISTRWYMLPILQQQIDFNSTVVNLATGLGSQQNEIAVTQVAMSHVMRQMLDTIEGQKRDIAQNIREIDKLTLTLIRLQERIGGPGKAEGRVKQGIE